MSIDTEVTPAHDQCTCWSGELTWRRTAELREALFDLLERPGVGRFVLDVSAVAEIDRTGVALLVGCHHRAAAMSRRLVLVDRGGTVSAALRRTGLLQALCPDAPMSTD